MNADLPGVSCVMPVLNEARHLREAVHGVLAQDYEGPVELVLALGPSKDGTDQVAAELAEQDPRVRFVHNPQGRTPVGLNLAIAASRYGIVVRVDGHAVLPKEYVRVAVETLQATGADNVGGIMAAEGVTDFERAVACAMRSKLGVGNAPFHTGGKAGPAPTVYLGVFRREALQRVGGYDEEFTRAQDWEMNHRLRESGGLVWFTPDLQVSYRPRSSVKSLARQYRDYGRWRRAVMRQHRDTVSLRYLAPPLALLGCAVGLALAPLRPWTLAVPASYAGLVVGGGLVVSQGEPVRVRLRVPVAVATMHMSWGWGFLTSRERTG
ncbi:MAG TPA: glycosyltransferase family 2 protein [Actinomycetes bacterium]|nr:glycosyltransferase family 2 protein [Actinomycetes bacterium]